MSNTTLLLCLGLVSVGIALVAADDNKVIHHKGVNSAEALTRYIDKENGVVCYQGVDNRTLSCVKVREVPHGKAP